MLSIVEIEMIWEAVARNKAVQYSARLTHLTSWLYRSSYPNKAVQDYRRTGSRDAPELR